MAQTIDLSVVLASHIGVENMAKLRAFARWTRLALDGPTNGTAARVFVAGSAMRTKTFRDIDLYLVYEDVEYEQRYKPGYDGSAGEAWWFHCAAFGRLASDQTGLPIDFHIVNLTSINNKSPHLELL